MIKIKYQRVSPFDFKNLFVYNAFAVKKQEGSKP